MDMTPAGLYVLTKGMNSQGPSLSREALEKMEAGIREHTGSFRPAESYGIELLQEQQPQRPGPDAKLSTTFTDENVSEKARALSWLMDESKDIESCVGFNLGRKQLAQHVGGIGRQIDEAFAAGEITQQERDDLNAGLGSYAENVASQAERRDAMWGVMRQMAASTQAMVASGASREEMAAYAKSNTDSMQERISEFVKKHTAIDRELMAALIARARGGEDLTVPSWKGIKA